VAQVADAVEAGSRNDNAFIGAIQISQTKAEVMKTAAWQL
jgi:hypothetical protein